MNPAVLDAFALAEFFHELLSCLRSRAELESTSGKLVFRPTDAFAGIDLEPGAPVRPVKPSHWYRAMKALCCAISSGSCVAASRCCRCRNSRSSNRCSGHPPRDRVNPTAARMAIVPQAIAAIAVRVAGINPDSATTTPAMPAVRPGAPRRIAAAAEIAKREARWRACAGRRRTLFPSSGASGRIRR